MAVLVLTMMRFVMQERAEAVSDWLEGDEAAMVAAERKAAKLVGAWLTWLRCQSVEALPAVRVDMLINPGPGPDLDPGPNPNPNQVRMDMLIKRTGPGAAEVFTLETPHPNPHPNPDPHPDPNPNPNPNQASHLPREALPRLFVPGCGVQKVSRDYLTVRLRVTILYCIGLRRAYTVSSRGHDCHSLRLTRGR